MKTIRTFCFTFSFLRCFLRVRLSFCFKRFRLSFFLRFRFCHKVNIHNVFFTFSESLGVFALSGSGCPCFFDLRAPTPKHLVLLSRTTPMPKHASQGHDTGGSLDSDSGRAAHAPQSLFSLRFRCVFVTFSARVLVASVCSRQGSSAKNFRFV